MKCKNCKAFVLFNDGLNGRCIILPLDLGAYLGLPENDCLIDEWVLRRDEINGRGGEKYICLDGLDGPCGCLYRSDDESGCSHLAEGGHPRNCESAKIAEITDVVKNREGETT